MPWDKKNNSAITVFFLILPLNLVGVLRCARTLLCEGRRLKLHFPWQNQIMLLNGGFFFFQIGWHLEIFCADQSWWGRA